MAQKMTIVRSFSPPIGRYKIPNNLVSDLNNYVEEIIKDREKNSKTRLWKKFSWRSYPRTTYF